jgi:hypothetical protein
MPALSEPRFRRFRQKPVSGPFVLTLSVSALSPQTAPQTARRPDPPRHPAPPAATILRGGKRPLERTTAAAQEARTAPRAVVGPFRPRVAPAAQPAPPLPAIVRGAPPHSARRWRAPAPFVRRGRTAGGGRRAPHTATAPGSRLPASGPPGVRLPASRPSQTTAPRRRGPRLPGEHSPGDSPSPAILQPRRPIRHDLLDPPPSFQVLSPNPSLPAYGDPAPKLAGLISSPVRTHIGERPRKEGGGRRFIHVHSFAAPKRGQEVGQIRTAAIRRSPLQSEQPRRETPAPGLPTLGAGCAGPAVAGTVREAPQAPPSRPARLGSTFSRTRSQAAPSGPALGLCPSPPRRPRDGPRRAYGPRHQTSHECTGHACASA